MLIAVVTVLEPGELADVGRRAGPHRAVIWQRVLDGMLGGRTLRLPPPGKCLLVPPHGHGPLLRLEEVRVDVPESAGIRERMSAAGTS